MVHHLTRNSQPSVFIKSSDALAALQFATEPQMEEVCKLLQQAAVQPEASPDLLSITQYAFAGGGKRLRPMLCLAAASMFTDIDIGQSKLAAAIECVHTATLLHDDVIDNGITRRNRPTANVLWSNQHSILVGDFLFAYSFDLVLQRGCLPATSILVDAVQKITNAEVKQLAMLGDENVTLEAYLDLITNKTAVLFAASTQMGAMLAGADAEQLSALHGYGKALGTCFQIIDDIMDYQASAAQLGKEVGSDFCEGKLTAPLILALQQAPLAGRAVMLELLANRQIEGSFARMLDLIVQFDGIANSFKLAHHYCGIGQQSLACLPDAPIKQILHDLISLIAKSGATS